jgi:hypothetical protein
MGFKSVCTTRDRRCKTIGVRVAIELVQPWQVALLDISKANVSYGYRFHIESSIAE